MERLINFDPQWINDIVITGINIFILFFVMSYFLFNPAREVLEKRRKRIAGDLETAKTSREDALALKAEYEDKIKSIDKEAQEILDAARKKAKKQEADILSEAREEANRIVDRANREIELEKKKALEDMKTEIVSIASLMAEKAVAASMDVKIQDSLIEETLKEIILQTHAKAPQELGRGILQKVLALCEYKAADDMTVLAAGVWKK